ncbi:MAG: helix-turn-helix transcriptional regulator [Gemmatimonadetes bacterium]|nr:helix-turn-helix transcriptional regulator [Gemmatimonadota bacterium]MYD63383.1 helix-turn-helix transcriptional regulator [Gemmatimonadota bacterium]
MSVAKRIALLRGQKTLTQFAREHQTTPQNIHRYEKGRPPSANFLTSLAYRGININWVLTGEGAIYVKKQKASSTALLSSELEQLPEEFREALRVTVREADQPPPPGRKLHLTLWCHKVLRKAQDEIDRLFGT